MKDDRFHTVYATIGPDAEVNRAKYRIDVGPKWLRPEGVEALKVVARETAAQAPESTVTAENPPMIEGLGSWFPIMVSIAGPDYAVLEPTARKVFELLKDTRGAADVKLDFQPGKRELRVVPDRDLAARAGLPMVLLGYNVRIAMEGEKAGQLRDRDASGHDRETDIRVRLRAEDRGSPESLARIPLSTDAKDPLTPVLANMPPPPPRVVRIGDVSTVEQGIAPSRIVRENRERRIVVSASAVGRPLGDLYAEVKPQIDAHIPQGYTVEYLGNVKDMEDSNESFGMAFGLGILFIYLVLASQFESFLHPLTIMVSLPLALVGALVGLFLYGAPLSMGSQIGIILLMGLVTKNAILLIDSALVFQREGMTARQAILAAGPRRLRPILMTSSAMVLGMLPTALSHGSGSEFRAPMAIAVIGGVISSTLLTLLVVPTVYLGVEWLRGLLAPKKVGVDATTAGVSLVLLAAGALALAPTEARAEKLTLAQAYEAALKHNPDLALAAEQVRGAQINVDRAWAYFLPQAKLQGTYTWYDEELEFSFKLPPNLAALAGDLPPTKIQESPTFQWQAQVILPLVNLEGLAARKASRAAVTVSEQTVEAARQEVLLGVAYAYHTIASLERAALAAEQAKLNAREMLRVAEAQRAAETATELGVVRARTAEAEAHEMAIQVRAGRDSALAGLRRLTGLTGEVEVEAVSPAPQVPSGDVTQWLDEARKARADLRADDARVSAAEAMDEGYWATYVPTIAGQATYWQTTNEGLTGQGDGANWGLIAEWKLYDGGLREAKVAEQESQLRSARLLRESHVAAVREALERDAADLSAATASLATARTYEALATRGQQLALVAYQAGTVTNLEVSAANGQQMKAAAGLAQAEVRAAIAALKFEKGLGRPVGPPR